MKIYYLFTLLFFVLVYPIQAQNDNLSDVLATKYCNELSKIDTATKSNFENILPKLDEKIIFSESGFLPLIVDEVIESKSNFKEFYSGMYNQFASGCPAYQVLYGLDTTVQLKDPGYFTNAFCDCFNEETGGQIENGDLTNVLKACNEKLGKTRAYKQKVRRELRNKDLSRQEFSEYITARFLTECDLIVDHMFNRQAKYLERNTIIMLRLQEKDRK